MQLVYQYNTKECYKDILDMCKISKNLYNQTWYIIMQRLESDKYFYSYYELNSILKETLNLEGKINYSLLKAQVAQQIIKQCWKDFNTAFTAIRDFKKHSSKYKGCPKLPYAKRKKSYYNLIYTNQCASIKDGKLILNKSIKINIPKWSKYKDKISSFNQVQIIPVNDYFKIRIIYTIEEQNINLDSNEYISIDLGVNNFATIVSSDNRPLIYNGRQIKAINQYFNKEVSKYKSILDKENKNKRISKRIKLLWDIRDNKLNDLYHKISRNIVNYCISSNKGNIVIGLNRGWKDSIDMGKKSNQNFVYIGYDKFISFLKYKCSIVGIKFYEIEESYTSKTDALMLDEVGVQEYNRRKKRGLFQSGCGKLINADVNGAINILRKYLSKNVVTDSCFQYINKIIDSGLLFNPIKFKDLYDLKYI